MKHSTGANIINAGIHRDMRGALKYFNDFNLEPVKRFYISEHTDTSVVKAWQGHKVEGKWFYVLTGAFKVLLVKPDNWETPSPELPIEEFALDSSKSEILEIPGGYATGFQASIPNSSLMIFSDCSLEESVADDFRFDRNLWYKW